MVRAKSTFILPKWENKTAPCGGADGCPAGTNIAGAMYALSRGKADVAWRIMMESHPLRGVLGRVCYNFCENPCNRGALDKPIAIQHLEMVLADEGFDPKWRPSMKRKNGKSVAIIGAGPAGLTAAYFLVREGYSVEIFDAQDKPGGMMRYGIPEYRLERSVLDREINFILSLGVKLNSNHRIDNKKLKSMVSGKKYQAVLLAAGADRPIDLEMKGGKKAGEYGIEFLRTTQNGNKPSLKGKSVVVIGGGNTALDTCRSAVRLGAKTVTVAYRRTQEEMPAHNIEFTEAKEEGVEFRFLLSPVAFNGKEVTFQKNRLGEPDESGRRRPEPIKGETEKYAADKLFVAIGQQPSGWEKPGKVKKLSHAGDVLPDSPGTVIHAIADGKRAAADIHGHLSGGKALFPKPQPEVPYEQMNILRYYKKKMRLRTPPAPSDTRAASFDPVLPAVSVGEAVVEAARCFYCGTCVGGKETTCDWCFHACDNDGVEKLMKPWAPEDVFYKINDHCDGCARCWGDCPRHVVTPAEIKR
ncbi:MAG: FAD-dependent oxidoreductase [Nitrospinota bacterium]